MMVSMIMSSIIRNDDDDEEDALCFERYATPDYQPALVNNESPVWTIEHQS